jgi:hypothetical protein
VIVSDIFDVELPDAHVRRHLGFDFLEHLPTQEAIASFLEKMHAAAARGGRIAVMGLNFRYCAPRVLRLCRPHARAHARRGCRAPLRRRFRAGQGGPCYLPCSFRSRLPASRTLTRRYLPMLPTWRFLGGQFLVIGNAEADALRER